MEYRQIILVLVFGYTQTFSILLNIYFKLIQVTQSLSERYSTLTLMLQIVKKNCVLIFAKIVAHAVEF